METSRDHQSLPDIQRLLETSIKQQKSLETTGYYWRPLETSTEHWRSEETTGSKQRLLETSRDPFTLAETPGGLQRPLKNTKNTGDPLKSVDTTADQ